MHQVFNQNDIHPLDDNSVPINILLDIEQRGSLLDAPIQVFPSAFFRPVDSFCAICLDSFMLSDVVSWSSNHDCSHTFHRDCILHWLLVQNDVNRARAPSTKNESLLLCPCCRVQFMEQSSQTTSMSNTCSEVVSGSNGNNIIPASVSAEGTETSIAETNSQDSLSVSALDP